MLVGDRHLWLSDCCQEKRRFNDISDGQWDQDNQHRYILSRYLNLKLHSHELYFRARQSHKRFIFTCEFKFTVNRSQKFPPIKMNIANFVYSFAIHSHSLWHSSSASFVSFIAWQKAFAYLMANASSRRILSLCVPKCLIVLEREHEQKNQTPFTNVLITDTRHTGRTPLRLACIDWRLEIVIHAISAQLEQKKIKQCRCLTEQFN